MSWQDGRSSITGQKQASQHLLRLNLVQFVLVLGPGVSLVPLLKSFSVMKQEQKREL